jgi:Gpi18-like mannosyltransferase
MVEPQAGRDGTQVRNRMPAGADRLLLAGSILLQLGLAYFLGHAYDMRIILSTGYEVGNGMNPYMAQDLSAVFHNSTFQGITTLGYPPPWSIVLGLIYLCSYKLIPNFLFYNLATKLPIVAANICVAYLVTHILKKSGVREENAHWAWVFMLFNPFLLLTSSAWGQFDPIMAVLVLLALFQLNKGKIILPAILVALAISLKPTSIGLVAVIFIYLAGRSLKNTLAYFIIFGLAMLAFCILPFFLFRWDPAPILQHWNNQFTVGGGLSFMTFLEYIKGSYQLPGQL